MILWFLEDIPREAKAGRTLQNMGHPTRCITLFLFRFLSDHSWWLDWRYLLLPCQSFQASISIPFLWNMQTLWKRSYKLNNCKIVSVQIAILSRIKTLRSQMPKEGFKWHYWRSVLCAPSGLLINWLLQLPRVPQLTVWEPVHYGDQIWNLLKTCMKMAGSLLYENSCIWLV